jgi:hypothetical protein
MLVRTGMYHFEVSRTALYRRVLVVRYVTTSHGSLSTTGSYQYTDDTLVLPCHGPGHRVPGQVYRIPDDGKLEASSSPLITDSESCHQ